MGFWLFYEQSHLIRGDLLSVEHEQDFRLLEVTSPLPRVDEANVSGTMTGSVPGKFDRRWVWTSHEVDLKTWWTINRREDTRDERKRLSSSWWDSVGRRTHPSAHRTVAVSGFIWFLQVQRVEIWSGGKKLLFISTRKENIYGIRWRQVTRFEHFIEKQQQLTSGPRAAGATSAQSTLVLQMALC